MKINKVRNKERKMFEKFMTLSLNATFHRDVSELLSG